MMDDSTFKNSAKFIVENRNEIEKYYSDESFWNDVIWASENDTVLWISTNGFESLCA